jgi:hypothetical protein
LRSGFQPGALSIKVGAQCRGAKIRRNESRCVPPNIVAGLFVGAVYLSVVGAGLVGVAPGALAPQSLKIIAYRVITGDGGANSAITVDSAL